MDRKDPQLLAYFHNLAGEKRLSKNRFKEFLTKRYKDQLADRILKNIIQFFNAFIINLDFGMFCESIEAFANQDDLVSIILLIIST